MKWAKLLFLAFLLALMVAPQAIAATNQSSVQVVDPNTIPNLYWEADLTPTHTIDIPGQGTRVVRGWGWGYDYTVSFPDRLTLVQPFGARYENSTITGRAWSQWGIPGDIQTWSVATTPPPEDPVEVTALPNGQKLYSRNLLPGVIPLYNVEGEIVIRALLWVWRDGETVRLRTWQVAVGRLVPVDPSIYNERPASAITRPYSFDQFKGGEIAGIHLSKAETFTNKDGWTTNRWVADRFTLRGAETVVFGGGLYFLEPSIFENMPWYLKSLGDTWDPSRLVGLSLCPHQNVTPIAYLWEGECP